ncbi:cation/H(+) antiporter 15-like [Dorcoceras hygrometricum]|uniref:Cation/H(+) antiporter 15-like n=1 Tax=Dorcoceras hygrometricum TaxID=472368 RepID=A0A2Z7ARJ8_9LAMI|nr:cation/H(+) antiporter 15-like [Dorcoceras hygrometricum]
MHTSWRSNSDIASVTRVSMKFREDWTNQYNQDLGLIHSTNGNHLESPNEGSRSPGHYLSACSEHHNVPYQ